MDKKKITILISIILIALLVTGISVYFILFNNSKSVVKEPKESEKEVVIDLKKEAEIEFEAKRQAALDNKSNEEYLAMKEALEKVEKENEEDTKVVEPTEGNGFTEEKHVGKLDIKFTPGQKGNNINEVKEQRKGYIDNVFTADADELGAELEFEDFKKEVTAKNKNLVENLDKSLDFKTLDNQTYITKKGDKIKSIFIYDSEKSSLGDKSEQTYFDSSIWIDSAYYLESEENALIFHKMINDSGFEITKEELDIGVDKAIKNRGSEFHVIRNYKFISALSYDFIKINKIN